MAVEDPFFTVKTDVETAQQNIAALYENWKRLLSTTNTSNNDEFEFTAEQLTNSLKNVEFDLQDLDETIAIVEQNPHKFKLTPDEILRRKKFIAATKAKISEVNTDLNSPTTKGKLEKDKRDTLMRQNSSRTAQEQKQAAFDKRVETDNQRFLEENSTQLLVQRQDNQLDEVHKTVGVLKQQAIAIGNELDDQDQLLSDVEDGVDNVGGRLKNAMNKLQDVYKKSNEKASLWLMCGLIVVIVVLVVLFFVI